MVTEIVIHQIESRAKIEALIGTGILTLIGLMSQKIWVGESIPVEIFYGLILLGAYYFILEFMSYLKFYVQKIVFIREQESLSKIKVVELEVEIRKLGAKLALAQVEVAVA